MIYEHDPLDWKDLQSKVCGILNVCGFNAEVEKDITTVRGPVNIDVWAIDLDATPTTTCLVECKHWASSVPKSIVHAFRTVVSDAGAHYGFIVASGGFQSGAHEAAESSNVRLVTWTEFQQMFLERWLKRRYKQIEKLLEDIFEFYDPLYEPLGNALHGHPECIEEYKVLVHRYAEQARINPWNQMMPATAAYPPSLPFKATVTEDGKPVDYEFRDYFTLMRWHEEQATKGIAEFSSFVAKYQVGADAG